MHELQVCGGFQPFNLALNIFLPSWKVSQDRESRFRFCHPSSLTLIPGLSQKCDGAKPICGPCLRHPKDDACEYSDGPGRSRTKALEDQVSRLEARLQELENPEASTPSVKLHDPYAPQLHLHEPRKISKSPPPQLFLPVGPMTLGPLSPFSPTSTSSSLPSGRHWNTFSALKANTELTGSSGPSGPSKSPLRQLPANSPFLGADVSGFPPAHCTAIDISFQEPSFLLIQNL
jgi:hypothetical protein